MRNGSVSRLIVAILVLACGRARAASDGDLALARAHFATGGSYYDQARYDDALREFQEAYRLSTVPAFLYNMALCEEHLGALDKAVVALEQYLRDDRAMSPDERHGAEARLETLRSRMVDAARGTTVPGEGDQTLPLEDSEPPSSPLPSAATAAPTATGEARAPRPGRALALAGGALVAAGIGVALGGGVGLGALASSRAEAITAASRDRQPYDPSLERERASFAALSIAGYAVGGAAALAGGALLLVGARRPSRAATAMRVTPWIASGGAGLVVSGAL